MAVRVIEEGKLPDPTYRGRCGHCGCLVECEKEDTNGYSGQYETRCPTEGCGHNVPVKQLPLASFGWAP